LPLIYNTLVKYVNKDSDVLVASIAIRYLLDQLDTRQQKEIMISNLLRDLGDSNLYIKSELLMTLGLFYAEKTDDANAARLMAMAYHANRYNRLAFEKLNELIFEDIGPVPILQYLRLNIRQNPLDLDATLAFAKYAQETQLYDVAAGSYEYAADLLRFLHPNQNLPAGIYLDWIVCCLQYPAKQLRCLQLAEQFRKQAILTCKLRR